MSIFYEIEFAKYILPYQKLKVEADTQPVLLLRCFTILKYPALFYLPFWEQVFTGFLCDGL